MPAVGLITNKLPANAVTTHNNWYHLIFSFNIKNEKITTKNGDNLFKLDATPNGNVKIGEVVTVPAKMLLTVLKAFQKDTVLF